MTIDAWAILFEAVLAALVTIFIYRSESARQHNAGLESRLHKSASELIDSKFTAIRDKLDEFGRRLGAGDRLFDQGVDRDHKLELKLSEQLSSLSYWVRDNASSKDIMEKHERADERRFAAMAEQHQQILLAIGELRGEITTLSADIQNHGGHRG